LITIDEEEFKKLCSLHCTQVEIAEFFNCSPDTIDRWCKRTYQETFAEVFKKKSSAGKISLRRKQYSKAMEGNVPLLIWLGKQFLGQRDSYVTEAEVNTGERRLVINLKPALAPETQTEE
jgi:IS30 family transposase